MIAVPQQAWAPGVCSSACVSLGSHLIYCFPIFEMGTITSFSLVASVEVYLCSLGPSFLFCEIKKSILFAPSTIFHFINVRKIPVTHSPYGEL